MQYSHQWTPLTSRKTTVPMIRKRGIDRRVRKGRYRGFIEGRQSNTPITPSITKKISWIKTTVATILWTRKMQMSVCSDRYLETHSSTSGHIIKIKTKTTSSHNRALLVQAAVASNSPTLSLEWPWPITDPCTMVKLMFVKHHLPLKTYSSSRTK